MARLASFAHHAEPQRSIDDPLHGDRIDFDTWLLPPEVPGPAERAIRFCSTTAGPVAFTAALTCFVAWIA